MATIKDIANRLGVSVSTVSKGLNGASDISDELRQTVLDTAVEMGYSTKRSRREENRRLCLMVENMEYESPGSFAYGLILGFRQNAFRARWDVNVVPVDPVFQAKEKYDTYILKNGYCGAFLIGFALQDPWMKQLETTTMPTVLLDNFIAENPNVCYIGTDSYEGIDLAVRHLYTLGHKKIAFLNGSLHSLVADQRQEAFENAMKKYGLQINPALMARGYFVPDCAKYHGPGFLAAGATAILCGNDLIAQGVYDECHARGLSIPEDISIVGFDDLPPAASFTPPLTTIRQELNELGRCGYVMLESLIRHIPISQTLMRPSLIERDSTSRVASAPSGSNGDMK
jgi:LacI family transcriptional regulator